VLAKAVWLMLLLLPVVARADRLGVAVREGPHDGLIVERLRGQLADLEDVTLTVDASIPEPTLDAQLASAEHIASDRGARVVVWFVPRGRALEVAIATPAEHRLFIREIPPATDSTMAEAAAIAVRGALRAIAAGGTIGIELPASTPHEPEPEAPAPAPPAPVVAAPFALEASLGWQAALDGGPSPASQALVQRTSLAHGSWAASLALALGVPGTWRPAQDTALDISRSGALLEIERRLGGGLAAGIGAGALIYHRSTTSAPSGLAPTPSASTPAFAATAELSWHAHLAHRLGLVVAVGLDVVAHAPAASLSRNGMVEVAGTIRAAQPRASVAVEIGSW
jgi:hypothetical protein